MRTRLIRIGISQEIGLPKKLPPQHRPSGEVEVCPTPEGLLITPIAQPTRQGWEAQLPAATANGQERGPTSSSPFGIK